MKTLSYIGAAFFALFSITTLFPEGPVILKIWVSISCALIAVLLFPSDISKKIPNKNWILGGAFLMWLIAMGQLGQHIKIDTSGTDDNKIVQEDSIKTKKEEPEKIETEAAKSPTAHNDSLKKAALDAIKTKNIKSPAIEQPTYDGRCMGYTKKGVRCSRKAEANGYCWQH